MNLSLRVLGGYKLLVLAALCTVSVEAAASVPATPPALAARIERLSDAYLGVPYGRDPLGEGPGGEVDRDPLYDRCRVDCVTFVEQVLAEAIAARPEAASEHLRRIRYRDGVVGFPTRNHYLIADWLPNNAWLVRDVTAALGGGRTRRIAATIDRPAFLRRHRCDPKGAVQERIVATYIPRAQAPRVAERIPTGTVAILVQRRPGILAAHTGWLLRSPGKPLLFRHASSRNRRVVDEPFLEYLRAQPPGIVGVKFCVIRGQ